MQYIFYICKKLPDFSGSFSIHILLNDMYALLGANSSTFAAANALALIDVSKVVLNGDSTVLAGLHALHAANAACLTSLHSYSALILVVAHYKQLIVSGNNLDNVVGAGGDHFIQRGGVGMHNHVAQVFFGFANAVHDDEHNGLFIHCRSDPF